MNVLIKTEKVFKSPVRELDISEFQSVTGGISQLQDPYFPPPGMLILPEVWRRSRENRM